jgi:hypothetical protein
MFRPYQLRLDLHRIAAKIAPAGSQDDARKWFQNTEPPPNNFLDIPNINNYNLN